MRKLKGLLMAATILAVVDAACGDMIAVLGDGRLFLARRDAGQFSSDNGKTWSAPVRLPTGAGSIIVAEGRIVVMVNRAHRTSAGIYTRGDILMTSSTDGGKTWTDPREIPFPYKYATGITHNGIRLQDGSLFVGVSWDMTIEREGGGTQSTSDLKIGALVSTDEGKGWEFVDGDLHAEYPDHPVYVSGVDEPSYVQLPNGDIYLLARTGAGCLYEARSSDGGKTWSDPKPTPLKVADSPSAMWRLRTGEVVLVAQPAAINQMCAWISTDDCRTWLGPKQLYSPKDHGPGGRYPSVTQAPDGTIVAAWPQYARNVQDGIYIHPQGIVDMIARFNRAWLLEGTGQEKTLPGKEEPSLEVTGMPPAWPRARPVHEEPPIPDTVVPWVQSAPVIDGECEESCWKKAAVLGDFKEMIVGKAFEPPVKLADEKTQVRVFYNPPMLYVAVTCFESRIPDLQKGLCPEKWTRSTPIRYGDLRSEDIFEIFLQTHPNESDHTARESGPYFQLAVNPNGATADLTGGADGGNWNEEWTWDAVRQVQTAVKSDRWQAEIAISLDSITPKGKGGEMPGPGTVWRANFCRTRSAKPFQSGPSRYSSWSHSAYGFHRPERFGELVFGPTPDR